MKHLMFAFTLATAVGLVAAPPPPGARKGPAPARQQSAARPAAVKKPAAKPVAHPPARPAARPAAKPAARPASHAAPRRVEFRESSRRMNMHGAGAHRPPPHHNGFHAHRPHGARYWGRPPAPPMMGGAMHGWTWVDTPWSYTVDGVYYYGEGYYFDGYNYCYNGGFHYAPPPVQPVVVPPPVVAAPAPVGVQQPVVASPAPAPVVVQQPVVTAPQPVVVTPPPPPPPPPPRTRGLLDVLFGH